MYLLKEVECRFPERIEVHPMMIVAGILLAALLIYQYINFQKMKNKAPK